jgi:hypothetical protein
MRVVSLSLSGLKAAKSVSVKRLGLIVCMSNKIVFYPRFSVPGLLLAGVVRQPQFRNKGSSQARKLPMFLETHQMNLADNLKHISPWT